MSRWARQRVGRAVAHWFLFCTLSLVLCITATVQAEQDPLCHRDCDSYHLYEADPGLQIRVVNPLDYPVWLSRNGELPLIILEPGSILEFSQLGISPIRMQVAAYRYLPEGHGEPLIFCLNAAFTDSWAQVTIAPGVIECEDVSSQLN
jgi:hypothetical protein